MNLRDIIPKHKLDFDSINKLKAHDKDALRPIVPDLLMWLQDINWPIASEISDILLQFDKELFPYIREVLHSDDSLWKYSILIKIIDRMAPTDKFELKQDLEKLSNNPDLNDKEEGIDEISKEILQSLY
ncbi:DUF5071 domain-containing protein [Paenibacillus sp. MSJ-34]|uniref:DUF5071 domain-containing protein n=1 Tax=Paenibacillus sp. MSJ-34 TaxID=2841529 RepID=UPI001C106A58|nr:DUF5071 domain-containing protein [Paenibacillus sp. MSJ-34]MBU5445553.1 DUF5071 domain-containing protein [Paenibacillus sp. MSJ-34]